MSSELLNEAESLSGGVTVSKDDYSWFKMHYKNFKRKSVIFVEEFMKNFHRIQWCDSKRVFKETCFVIVIAGILTSFFYLIFMIMQIIV